MSVRVFTERKKSSASTASIRSSTSSCSSTTSTRSALPEDTLVVCDWDDTLLPTSWLQRAVLGTEAAAVRLADLTYAQKTQLAELETQLLTLLGTLQGVGTMVVITNATDNYVELTSAAFLPRVAAWLTRNQVCIVSARSWFEAAYPDNVAAWKLHAFQEVVKAWRASHGGRPPQHIVSVGDSLYERWAAHATAQDGTAIKTIKLREQPSCRAMAAQARYLAQHVPQVVALEGDMDIAVVLR